jgi:hypothetical protein
VFGAKPPSYNGAMARKAASKNRLADDIRESLREADDYFSGRPTKVIVHRVSPKETDVRLARQTLGLSQDEFKTS